MSLPVPVLSLSCAAIAASALLAVAPSALQTPSSPATPSPAAPTPPAVMAFPQSWIGHWKGDALNDAGRAGLEPSRFTMELIIAPTEAPDRFRWTIVYAGASGRQERPYELLVRNAERGEYAIDEKNGIVLESRLLQGTLFSHFTVQDTCITTRERLEGAGTADERIEVEMVVTSVSGAVTTGNANGVPDVKTWMPQSVQRATLRRVPKT